MPKSQTQALQKKTNSEQKKASGKPLRARVLQTLILVLFMVVIYFGAAGNLNQPWAWVYFEVYTIFLLLVVRLVPEPPALEKTAQVQSAGRDPLGLLSTLGSLMTPVSLFVAGLDVGRFHWSPALLFWVPAAALAVFALAYVLSVRAMLVNPFYSLPVNMPKALKHKVVARGPYRFIRHPGYASSILFSLAVPLILGSLWALIPGGIAAVLSVVQTAMEDNLLRRDLSGYTEYTHQVRARLVPGIW